MILYHLQELQSVKDVLSTQQRLTPDNEGNKRPVKILHVQFNTWSGTLVLQDVVHSSLQIFHLIADYSQLQLGQPGEL